MTFWVATGVCGETCVRAMTRSAGGGVSKDSDKWIPLLDISVDDYLGLMAEMRNMMTVELDETLTFPIFTGGASNPRALEQRMQLPPRTTSGSLNVAGSCAASALCATAPKSRIFKRSETT